MDHIMTENETTPRFNASAHIGSAVEIFAYSYKTIATKYGDKTAAVADVYVVDAGDNELEFLNALVFNVGIVSDLKSSTGVLRGVLTEVPTKGGYTAVVVK